MNSKMAFIIFFSIVFVIYSLVNIYIYKHLLNLNIEAGWKLVVFKSVFFTIVLAYPLGRFFERVYPSIITDIIVKTGSLWLGAMLFLTLMFITIDLLRLVFKLMNYFFNFNLLNLTILLPKITLVVLITSGILVSISYLNALLPRVNFQSISTNKQIGNHKQFRIGMASDLHLGTVISNGRLNRFVNMMNEQKPDIILLAGDIFDEDIGPVIKRDMGKLISQLNAPLGVFAVTGNHEYIGGVVPAVEYLQKHGVRVVRDSAMLINEIIYIIGREDRQSKYMGNYNRKTLNNLVDSLDKSKFMVLLDHQPYNLHEAVENNIDIQFSGHTHHGQLWPFNLITKAIFEVSRGLKKKDNTHIFVSTGFGTWGPPMRLGNRPEIVIFDINTKVN
jgi:uncharacterized protein